MSRTACAAVLALAAWGCGGADRVAGDRSYPAVGRDAGGELIWMDPLVRRPSPPPPGRPVSDGGPFFQRIGERKAAMLTFDCAWVEPENAFDLLDALRAEEVKATFFISGPFIFRDYRLGLAGGLNTTNLPVIRRLIDDGHEFGNHAVTHAHLADHPDYRSELNELRSGWDAVVRALYGESPPPNAGMLPLWRAPYGERDVDALTAASCGGYPIHLGWDDDTLDSYGRPPCTAGDQADCWDGRRMTDRVLDRLAQRGWPDSEVALAHLQNPYMWGASGELTRLIGTLRDRGYALVRVSESLRIDPQDRGPAGDRAACLDPAVRRP